MTSSKLKNLINDLIKKYDYYEAKKIMGVSFTKLAEIMGERIPHDLANEILVENIKDKVLPTKYKEFHIWISFDGIVYWGANLKTGRFSPDITERIDVVATPFWDGNDTTPVELDWYSLVQDDLKKSILEIHSDGRYFHQIKDKTSFKDINELFQWYKEIYLPSIYEIIITDYIPRVHLECEDELNKKFGKNNFREQIERIKSIMVENDSSKEKIIKLIKGVGLKNAANIVGGIERLVKLGYNDDFKEYAKDNNIKLVEITDNNPPNMYIDDFIIEKLNLPDFSKNEKELGKFRFGPYGKGENYSFTARVRKVKRINNGVEQILWHVVGTSGSYGFGYSYISKQETMGKKVRLQIFKQIIDKYNLNEYL